MAETLLDNIPKSELKEMFEHAVHLGHPSQKWHPKIKPYIYTQKDGVHIFDLRKTYLALQDACSFAETLGSEYKSILFVSTKPQGQKIVTEAAEECECPYVDSKWLPGLLTNFATVKARLKELKKLEEEQATGQLEQKYLKKEISTIKKGMIKIKEALGGIERMNKLPNALFIIDIKRDHIALLEARKLNIPVIAITDSNTNPKEVDFPIPANDDALKSIDYIVNKITQSYIKGKLSIKK